MYPHNLGAQLSSFSNKSILDTVLTGPGTFFIEYKKMNGSHLTLWSVGLAGYGPILTFLSPCSYS